MWYWQSYFCFEVVEDGYEFFAKRQLVTLFSAPNYCGEFDNAGAMMSVDETLMCSFQVCKTEPVFIQIFMSSACIVFWKLCSSENQVMCFLHVLYSDFYSSSITYCQSLQRSVCQIKRELLFLSQILKPADKKLYPYGGGGGMGSGRPVTPPRNSAKSAKAKK